MMFRGHEFRVLIWAWLFVGLPFVFAATEYSAEELLRFELHRLVSWNPAAERGPVIDFPAGTLDGLQAEIKKFSLNNQKRTLEKIQAQDLIDYLDSLKVKGKEISEKEMQVLLGVLRALNQAQRRGKEKSGRDDYTTALLNQADALSKSAPNGRPGLPEPLEQKLKGLSAQEENPSNLQLGLADEALTNRRLAEILKKPGVLGQLDDGEKAELLGATRLKMPESMGDKFFQDLRLDSLSDQYARSQDKNLLHAMEKLRNLLGDSEAPPRLETNLSGGEVPKVPRLNLPQSPQNSSPSSTPSPHSPPLGHGGAGSQSGGGGGGGAQLPEEPLPPTKSLKPDESAKLEELTRNQNDVAANYRVYYADGSSGQCQLTWVARKTLPGGEFCHLAAVTASHCSKDESNIRSIVVETQVDEPRTIALAPLESGYTGFDFINAPIMGDMGLLQTVAPCSIADPNKVIPLAKEALAENDTLRLEKKGDQTLYARAMGPFSQDPSMTMVDFRVSSRNAGMGVLPGDSGGPVVNSDGKLVGVISARFTDYDRSQIGLVTSGSALAKARTLVDFLFPEETQLADVRSRTTLPTH